MINRLLIRIKVLQILYMYSRVEGMSTPQAVSILRQALDQSYRLYIYLTGLPLEFARLAGERLDRERAKFTPDQEVVRALTHLQHNPMVDVIFGDEEYMELYELYRIKRDDLDLFLNGILTSEVVEKAEAVNAIDWDNFDEVQAFWRKTIWAKGLEKSDDLAPLLENASAYLNDAVEIVMTFVTKAFNAINTTASYSTIIKPPYSSEDDEAFGPELLQKAIEHEQEYRDMISDYFKNWDKDRVSEIDYAIMQLALTEALNFPLIATRVTINEYLNLAHYYSAPNSSSFINGILHELFNKLKQEGKILGE